MPITLFAHAALGFQAVRLEGVLSGAELAGLGVLHQQYPEWARSDAIHLAHDSIDVSQIDYSLLHKLRAHYRALQAGLDLHLVRRSAWVCANPQAWEFLEYWLADRHTRDGQGTDVCLVSSLPEARLLFDPEELEAVEAWADFAELHRLETP